jgi:hypothetical protein
MTDQDGGNVGRRAGAPIEPRSDSAFGDIPKTVVWILGGFSLVSAGLAALTVAPRLIGTYTIPVIVALVLMVIAFLLAAIAGFLNLVTAQWETKPKALRPTILGLIAVGLVCMLSSLATVLIAGSFLLAKPEVPRLALNVVQNQGPDGQRSSAATVKVKFEADALDAGQSLVLDVLALYNYDPMLPGERIYRAIIGSDATGKVVSEIETEIFSSSYSLVVAEVYPVSPAELDKDPASWGDELQGYTRLCSNIEPSAARSCAFARVPRP